MIIVCHNCSTRLQIDEEKTPAGVSRVRCPKCKNTIDFSETSASADQSALGVGGSPSTEHPRYDRPTATAYRPSDLPGTEEGPVNAELITRLVNLLGKGVVATGPSNGNRYEARRKALICASEQYREPIARSLTENGYQAFIAQDTRQAVDTMRANQMEVVLLEPQFDAAEQGAAFVVREINILRPPQRRRLFFVLSSPSLRTMDAHAAFLNNVNAVVNINDIGDLPRILEIAFREYNELYRDLNQVLNLSAL